MKKRVTKYLVALMKTSEPVRIQFTKGRVLKRESHFIEDPLGEETKFSPVKGLVHKYTNRVLFKVSYRCAAHCQFCTRFRQIGSPEGDLSDLDVRRCLAYIKKHKEISDVILSGGDPLVTLPKTEYIFDNLLKIDSVKVIRIGTRLPIVLPARILSPQMTSFLRKVRLADKNRAIYILVHVNHSDELTPQALRAFRFLQRFVRNVGTQTVFLRGVNDSYDALENLFQSLYQKGIRPYYIYRCDPVFGVGRFIMPFRKEKKIMAELHRKRAGLALPAFVVDAPNGSGKIPVDLNFWENSRTLIDFNGKLIKI